MTEAIKISVQRLDHGRGLGLPAHATPASSGVDLAAAIDRPVTLEPGRHALIATGLAIAVPNGFEAQVRPRSGLALKHGVTVLNSPGTIDADYRGEIKVILINLGEEPFIIERGMRIAQLVIGRINPIAWQEVETLPDSDRGDGGFGSSGLTGNTVREEA
jgi:dUTP pyrophosphatase